MCGDVSAEVPAPSPAVIAAWLAEAELFSRLAPEVREALARECVVREVPARTRVVSQGDASHEAFVLVDGLLEVRKRVGQASHRVALFRPGATFGETALLSEQVRSADVWTVRDSRLLALGSDAFRRALMDAPAALLTTVDVLLRRRAGDPGAPEAPPVVAVVGEDPAAVQAMMGLLEGALEAAEVPVRRQAPTSDHPVAVFSPRRQGDALLLVEGGRGDAWTVQAARNAHHVLVVRADGDDPAPGPVERAAVASLGKDDWSLVLLEPPALGLMAWMADRPGVRVESIDGRGTLERLVARVQGSGDELEWLRRVALFSAFSDDGLRALAACFEVTSLPAGAVLFERGDAGQSLFVVVSGRIEVLDPDGQTRTRLGPGAALGELAILQDGTRTATVRTTRDSVLAELDQAHFESVMALHPSVGRRLAELVVERLEPQRVKTADPALVVAVVFLSDEPEVSEEVRALANGLALLGPSACVDRAQIEQLLGRGAADMAPGDPREHGLIQVLDRLESDHRHLLLLGDPAAAEWTRRCIRQADLVVVFGKAGPPPKRTRRTGAAFSAGVRARDRLLVLVHPAGTRMASGTARWLDVLDIDRWAHVAAGSVEDRGRLVRRLTRTGNGLVLGGGGSRGAAHLGVLAGLDEAGVVVDAVAGTSAGASIAGLAAMRMPLDQATRHVEALLGAAAGHLADVGPPVVSLLSGRQVRRLLQPWYGDVDMEDLFIPLSVAAADVARRELVQITRGPIWRAVRASVSLPGLWPAVVDADRLLVDGGVLDNLPTGFVEADCRHGTVVACDVAGTGAPGRRFEPTPTHGGRSGWSVLLRRLLRKSLPQPGLAATMTQTLLMASAERLKRAVATEVDVLVRPSMPGVGMFDIRTPDRVARAAARGREALVAALQPWTTTPAGSLVRGPDPVTPALEPPAPLQRSGPPSLLHMAAHTRLLGGLLRRSLRGYTRLSALRIAPPAAEPPQVVTVPGLGPDVELCADDEDTGVRPRWMRWAIAAANRLLPVSTAASPWSAHADPVPALTATFGDALPTPRVDWGAPTGPEALALFARHGLAAHRLAAHPEGGWVLDVSAMDVLPVRDGYARYGGVLRLHEDGSFHSLHRGRRAIDPADPRFEAEAFAFRSSAFVQVTVADHLGLCHYGVSNAALLAARRHLPASHPLRSFLRPFQYRTAAINFGALQSLIPRGALVHRGTSLRWSALQAWLQRLLQDVRYDPLPERLRTRGTHPDQLGSRAEVLPWSVDGTQWYAGLHAFVRDAFDTSPALSSAIDGRHRPATEAFWADLGTRVRGLPAFGRDGVTDGLTWLLHVVTALHSHVGHVAPYLRNPGFVAGRLLPGAARADPDNTGQLATVAVLTGISVPTILEDWTHRMPDRPAIDTAQRFRDWLAAFQGQIDARNTLRQQPFHSLSPRMMPCSVSR